MRDLWALRNLHDCMRIVTGGLYKNVESQLVVLRRKVIKRIPFFLLSLRKVSTYNLSTFFQLFCYSFTSCNEMLFVPWVLLLTLHSHYSSDYLMSSLTANITNLSRSHTNTYVNMRHGNGISKTRFFVQICGKCLNPFILGSGLTFDRETCAARKRYWRTRNLRMLRWILARAY